MGSLQRTHLALPRPRRRRRTTRERPAPAALPHAAPDPDPRPRRAPARRGPGGVAVSAPLDELNREEILRILRWARNYMVRRFDAWDNTDQAIYDRLKTR